MAKFNSETAKQYGVQFTSETAKAASKKWQKIRKQRGLSTGFTSESAKKANDLKRERKAARMASY